VWLQLRPSLAVDPSPLASLPTTIGAWHARDVPLEDSVEQELRADFNVQRVYAHPSGDTIVLYVGYYGTERGGRPEHVPTPATPAPAGASSRPTPSSPTRRPAGA